MTTDEMNTLRICERTILSKIYVPVKGGGD
jgi:hypothetical protein